MIKIITTKMIMVMIIIITIIIIILITIIMTITIVIINSQVGFSLDPPLIDLYVPQSNAILQYPQVSSNAFRLARQAVIL